MKNEVLEIYHDQFDNCLIRVLQLYEDGRIRIVSKIVGILESYGGCIITADEDKTLVFCKISDYTLQKAIRQNIEERSWGDNE